MATADAIQSTHHTTLKPTPGQLVFGRDMIFPVQFKANWASTYLEKARTDKSVPFTRESKSDPTYTAMTQGTKTC